MNFYDLRDEAPARATFGVHNDIHGITDVGLNRAVWQFHTTLEHAARNR
jgi:hypothetical protein